MRCDGNGVLAAAAAAAAAAWTKNKRIPSALRKEDLAKDTCFDELRSGPFWGQGLIVEARSPSRDRAKSGIKDIPPGPIESQLSFFLTILCFLEKKLKDRRPHPIPPSFTLT